MVNKGSAKTYNPWQASSIWCPGSCILSERLLKLEVVCKEKKENFTKQLFD